MLTGGESGYALEEGVGVHFVEDRGVAWGVV